MQELNVKRTLNIIDFEQTLVVTAEFHSVVGSSPGATKTRLRWTNGRDSNKNQPNGDKSHPKSMKQNMLLINKIYKIHRNTAFE